MADKNKNNRRDLVRDSVNTLNAIAGDVTDAITRNDYSNLSGTITNRVAQLTDEVKAEAAGAILNAGKNVSAYPKQEGSNRYQQGTYQQKAQYAAKKALSTPFLQKKVSRTSQLATTTIGAGGTAIAGFAFLAFALNAFLLPSKMAIFLSGAIISGIVTGAFGNTLRKGMKKLRVIDKYFSFGRIAGDREYVPLTDFCDVLDEDKDAVYRDLMTMKKEGLLPQAKIDEQKTTLMLTQASYDQYLASEQSRKQREEEQKAQKETMKQAGADAEVFSLLDEGEAYVKTIRACNDEIPGEEMSGKLDRLENIMNRIFAQVKNDPSCTGELRRFMSYYLPTTVKLLRAYIDLEHQPDVENVRATRREIEESLDTINAAFEKLLDSLFQDVAWDISSDISVMKTMLAQDGLTEDHMHQ
ncbi:MAG: 5-bromo-4-chloroindolyl phosphate hydrolysis family protein [Lachnospiraceae bacterium]|nr:5-bromo-4-chloroindolyl phosphate hydrolysis family protein [Lachnospiraceae bacterium]